MAEKTYLKVGKNEKEIELDSNEYWKAGAIHFTNNAPHRIDYCGNGRRLVVILTDELINGGLIDPPKKIQ